MHLFNFVSFLYSFNNIQCLCGLPKSALITPTSNLGVGW